MSTLATMCTGLQCKRWLSVCTLAWLTAGCQTTLPVNSPTAEHAVSNQASNANATAQHDATDALPSGTSLAKPPVPLQQPSSGARITPYQQDVIARKNLLRIQSGQGTADSNLAAYNALIRQTQHAITLQHWDDAQRYALQAQRIQPRAADSYLYLAMLAKQQKQLSNSIQLARQGLNLAQTDALHKALWTLILSVAQQQRDTALQKQAQLALRSL